MRNKDTVRNLQDRLSETPLRVRGSIWTLAACWTVAVCIVLTWASLDAHAHAKHLLDSRNGGVQSEEAIHRMRWINIRDRLLGYGGMWIVGIAGIAIFSQHLRQQIRQRCEAEQKLQEAHDRLEHRVVERTAELADANRRLEDEITERRKAEEWLLESEQRFRSYFEQGLVGMAMLSPAKEWIEVNDRLCRMLGYTQDELAIVSWDSLTYPDDMLGEKLQFQSLLDGKAGAFAISRRFVRKDKAVVEAGVSAQCLRKQDGAIDCILMLVQEKQKS
jgi:PAS domain S-box-containing protein